VARRSRHLPSRTVSLLALFDLLLRRPSRGVSAEEAAREVGCSLRTAYRLLGACRDAGLAVRRDGTRRHVLRRTGR
jgi:predicted DNA-binding transcriptional regulator YafY